MARWVADDGYHWRPEVAADAPDVTGDQVAVSHWEGSADAWRQVWTVRDLTPSEIIDRDEAAGYDVQPEGFRLGLRENDRTLLMQLKTGLDVTAAADGAEIPIMDMHGASHKVTVLRFREIIVGYAAAAMIISARRQQQQQ